MKRPARLVSVFVVICLLGSLLLSACGDQAITTDRNLLTVVAELANPYLTVTPEPTLEPTPVPTPTIEPTTLAPEPTPTTEVTTIALKTPDEQETPADYTYTPVMADTPAPYTTPVPVPTRIPTTPRPVQTTAKPAPTATPWPFPTGAMAEVVRGKTGQKRVALTFDAGASGDNFPLIISTLKKYNLKLTFFLTGQWAQQNASYVEQISQDGNEIGNHSWDHPDFTKLTAEQIQDQVTKTEQLLSKLSGRTTKPLFRFPYGARDGKVMAVVNELGYRSIYWTLDSLDSVGDPKSVDFILNRITGQTDAQLDGEIILLHIGAKTSAQALPQLIDKLQARGFKIVTVSQLLK